MTKGWVNDDNIFEWTVLKYNNDFLDYINAEVVISFS